MTAPQDGRQLWKIWMSFTSTKDIKFFKEFLQVFHSLYKPFLTNDLPSPSTYLIEDAPHLTTLPDELLRVLYLKLDETFYDVKQKSLKISHVEFSNDMLACLICLCKNLDNIALIASLDYVHCLTGLASQVLLKLYKENTENLQPYTLLINRVLFFLECLFDPYFIWKRKCKGLKFDVSKCKFHPALLHDEVIPFFYECFQEQPAEFEIQSRLFNLFGSILSGSIHNATKAICPASVDVLLKIITDFSSAAIIRPEEALIRQSVLNCLVEMIRITHAASPDQRQVEVSRILEGYFDILTNMCKPEIIENKEEPKTLNGWQYDLIMDMLDKISLMLLDCCDKLSLQVIFVTSNCFESLLTVLEHITTTSSTYMVCQDVCVKVIVALTNILRSCKAVKKKFLEKHCYAKIDKAFFYLKGGPSKQLIKSLFSMATESDFNLSNSIQNVRPLIMIIDWIADLPNDDNLQVWVCKSMNSLCNATTHNRMTCCNAGMISTILRLLIRYDTINSAALDEMINLLENLGRLSISAAELKQMVSLLRTDVKKHETPYIDRLVSVMSHMARRDGKEGALHYFDFQSPDSGIIIPGVRKWGGYGFSFHAWISLESSMASTTDAGFSLTRYQIYSVNSGNGYGFEAFITMDSGLMVGMQIKKEYYVVRVPCEMSILDDQWHSLAVVHVPAKRPFGQTFVNVFLDGRLKLNLPMKIPNLNEPFLYCCIGCPTKSRFNFRKSDSNIGIGGAIGSSYSASRSVINTDTKNINYFNPLNWNWSLKKVDDTATNKVSSNNEILCIEIGKEEDIFGMPVSFYGQMGSVCLFNEALTNSQVSELYRSGPNSVTVFTADGILSELNGKLIIYYNAKACKDEELTMDLSTNSNHGRLIGRKCITWHIKDVINCIGGVLTLFPLLEQLANYNEKFTPNIMSDVESSIAINKPLEENPLNDDFVVVGETSVKSSVAGFFILLRNMIRGSPVNEDTLLTTNAISLLGALLQRLPTWRIDAHVLVVIRELIECVEGSGNRNLLYNLYQYLLFDFRIWSRSDFVVRIGHIQYILTLIKDNVRFFRKRYGVEFLLDTIKRYYADDLPSNLSETDEKTIRLALFNLIKYFIRKEVTFDELNVIMNFISFVEREIVLVEIFDVLICILETNEKRRSDQIILLFFEDKIAVEISYMLILSKRYGIDLKNKVIKFISLLLKSDRINDKSKGRLRLTDYGAFPGFINLLRNCELSISLILNLFDLTLEMHNFNSLFCLVQLLNGVDLNIKLEITRRLLDIMITNSKVVKEAVKQLAWQEIIVQLLVCVPAEELSNSNGSISMAMKNKDSANEINIKTSNVERNMSLNLSSFASQTVAYRENSSIKVPFKSPDDIELKEMDQNNSCSQLTSPTENLSVLSDDEDLVSLNLDDDQGDKSEELTQNILLILLTLSIHATEKSDYESWKNRYEIFSAIDAVAASSKFIIKSSNELKRRLLELMLQSLINHMKTTGTISPEHCENAINLIKIIHDFLTISSSSTAAGNDGSNDERFSEMLLTDIIDLFDMLGVWEPSNDLPELTWIGFNILLLFSARQNVNLCAGATARLHTLLHVRPVERPQESSYLISAISDLIDESILNNSKQYNYLIPVMKALIEKCNEMLSMSTFLTKLPDPSNGPKFSDDFRAYIKSDEWRNFLDKQILPSKRQYFANRFDTLQVYMSAFRSECKDKLMMDGHAKSKELGEGKLSFDKFVTEKWQQRRQAEQQRYVNYLGMLKNQNRSALLHWRATKAFLTGERGAWANFERSDCKWKLSFNENFSRMRPKLIVNYGYDLHRDASLLRDNMGHKLKAEREAEGINTRSSNNMPSIPTLKAAKVEDKDIGDDRLGDEEWNAITGVDRHEKDKNQIQVQLQMGQQQNAVALASEKKEKEILEEECELVTLVELRKGILKVTSTHIYFYHYGQSIGDDSFASCDDLKWSLSMIREIHFRRYNLRRSALEFFLIDQSNFFLNFQQKTRNKIYSKIVALRPPNLIYHGSRSPAELLKSSGLTQRWINRDISNFDYLIQLNTIAGRTYNDLSQYPVFPWILSDYTSYELDLNDESVYRDLSRPVGIINEKNEKEVREKYNQFEDPTGTIEKFHYGTHYSNAAGVMHYLIRIEPFTSLHIELQSGKFDVADRQFHSLPATWAAIMESPNDVKELIPEFFYFPEFLENFNSFDLGRLQGSGAAVDDVLLPNWAKNADDFIYKHRLALESEYVSKHLHEWIDLIFGYKQKGEAAVEALNVFYYCTYEGAVDLDAIKDDHERKALEGMINNFGQTPCQLLKEAHPKRLSRTECIRNLSILQNIGRLKTFYSEVYANNDGIVYVSVPRNQTRKLLQQGMPDILLTVSENGIIGLNGWLPYDKNIANYFTFDKDPTLNNSSKKLKKSIFGPLAPGLTSKSKLYVVTEDGKLLVSAGHWDNSLRVFSLSKNKTIAHHVRHTNVITCMALDRIGNHLMTGSRDTTCMIWEILHQQSGSSQSIRQYPIQTLYGHDKSVTDVALSIELDVAVSCSKDGTVIIHTARKGHYVRTIRPILNDDAILTHLAMDDLGRIVVQCKQPTNVQANRIETYSLHVFSINGKQLTMETSSSSGSGSGFNSITTTSASAAAANNNKNNNNNQENLNCMLIVESLLFLAYDNGRLIVKDVYQLTTINQLNLHIPILSLSITPNQTHILVGLKDGKLIIIGVQGVS